MNSKTKYWYRYRFAVYRYDYICIGMAISVEPYSKALFIEQSVYPTSAILLSNSQCSISALDKSTSTSTIFPQHCTQGGQAGHPDPQEVFW